MSPWIIGAILIGVGVAIVGILLFFGLSKNRSTKIEPEGVKGPDLSDDEVRNTASSMRARLTGLGLGIAGIIGVLMVRLWGMQVISSDDYVELANSNQTRKIASQAIRGRILDRNGVELVSNRPSVAVRAVRDVADNDLLVKRLANILGMPKTAVRRRIQDNTEGASAPRTVSIDVSMSTIAYITEHPDEFPGVTIESRSVRSYPQGNLAAHVLGYAGTISQEELEADTAEKGMSYLSGDIVGKTGVEAVYEQVLQGVRGETTVQVDAHGNVIGFVEEMPASPGNDVVLTIEANLQRAVEEALADGIKQSKNSGHSNAVCGAAVVLDPKTGEVLAMASQPTFDPSTFIGGIGMSDWDQLTNEESFYPLNNRAIAGLYPPASTIKGLSTFAALKYGISDLNSTYVCGGTWLGLGADWPKKCWLLSGHGRLGLVDGIANSCDIVFYEISKSFYYNEQHPEGLQETYREWGLGAKTGIDLPSEGEGRVPDAAWKASYFPDAPDSSKKWQGGDNANIVIGQGDMLVTPLQMALTYCGVALNGIIMRPHVMRQVLGKDGKTPVLTSKPEVYLTPEIAAEHLQVVHQGFEKVIPLSLNKYYRDMSVNIAGKTGTGEVNGKDDFGWFCGYGPVEDPSYVISVVIEEGGGGNGGPSYAGRKIFGAIFDENYGGTVAAEDGMR